MSVLGRILLVGAIFLLPSAVFAQEATLTGTISDGTGGVLPGVSVTALHAATGNRFEGVTDDRGVYRIAVRVGVYEITASLQGFATVARQGVQLLAGQTANISLQMMP